MDVKFVDIGNAYLNTETDYKVCFIEGSLFILELVVKIKLSYEIYTG